MYPETWPQFITTLEQAVPVLSPTNKLKVKEIIKWAYKTKIRGRNPPKDEIEWIRNQLIKIIGSSTGAVRTDLTNAWGFLKWFIEHRDVWRWKTYAGCMFWSGHWWSNACHDEPWADSPGNYTDAGSCMRAGYYWWNGKCHSNKLACRDYTSSADCSLNGCYWYNNRCNSSPYVVPPPPPPPEPPPPPALVLCNEITTQSECLKRGCYWYNRACHSTPETALPPPEPEPTPCSKHLYQTECEQAGCFWWGNACHKDMSGFLQDDFNIGLGLVSYESPYQIGVILNEAQRYIDYWLSVLGDDWEWAWDVAMQQAENEMLLRTLISPLIDWATRLGQVIGDVTQLEERSIVDWITSQEQGTGSQSSAMAEAILNQLDLSFSTSSGQVSMINDGLLYNLWEMQNQWEAADKQLGGATLDQVEEQLKVYFNLTRSTIVEIKAEIAALTSRLDVIIEEVDGEIDRPIFDTGVGLEYIIPATVGWVKDLFRSTGNIIFDAIEEVTLDLANSVNGVIDLVTLMPQSWIDDLKEKMGNSLSDYDLASDLLYQTIRSEVTVLIDEVYELSSPWVSNLASVLEDYLDLGVGGGGGTGERGPPGPEGAMGPRGFEGLQGPPGEPDGGAGLTIEEINAQLHDKLTAGYEIFSGDITGVVDWILKDNEKHFGDLDVTVTDLSGFLNKDMRDSLTGMVDAFGTPEALIGFILDVEPGDEGAMLDLMQDLIAMTFERGL